MGHAYRFPKRERMLSNVDYSLTSDARPSVSVRYGGVFTMSCFHDGLTSIRASRELLRCGIHLLLLLLVSPYYVRIPFFSRSVEYAIKSGVR